jgi:hypothetical protein
MARPETVPKSWLTTMLFGMIQQIQLKTERAGNSSRNTEMALEVALPATIK